MDAFSAVRQHTRWFTASVIVHCTFTLRSRTAALACHSQLFMRASAPTVTVETDGDAAADFDDDADDDGGGDGDDA